MTTLMLDAVDLTDATAQAETKGYAVIAIRRHLGWSLLKRRRHSGFSLTLFSQELLTLLDAGLTLVEAMETLCEKERNPEVRHVLDGLIAALYDGKPFSHAIQQFPSVFPVLYVAAVRASEKTSNISEALSRYVTSELQMEALRKKVISASIYPALLIGIGSLVMLFLLVYVVPKFSRIYEGLGTDLPLMSRMLMQWGKFLEANGALLLGLAGAALAGGIYAATQQRTSRWLMQQIWKIPAIGERMKVYRLSRFYRMLGMLLRGGIPVVSAMGMVSDLLPPSLRAQLALAEGNIRQGESISQAMELNQLTTPVAMRMLRVGERTGKMGEMMERIASFHDEEMSRWVDWFTRLFEPLLMAGIGIIIGVIVLLMYFPIFELAGSIQ